MATAFFPSTIPIQIRLNGTQYLSLSSSFLPIPTPILSSRTSNRRARDMVVRMGGGPRTFPGGVTKWQWKRMQEKKAKQLLKARLLRERQIYEMRKRAELKTALTQLERPWEAVQKAPNLFSVGADEQVKTLADRFQKPGGFDMWNERDGPQVFKRPNGELTSVRFFPKGAVHSIKPYTKEREEASVQEPGEQLRFDDWIAKGAGNIRKTRSRRDKNAIDVECTEGFSQNVPKENYSANRKSNDINEMTMVDSESINEFWENTSKRLSTKVDNPGTDKRKSVSKQHNLGSFEDRRDIVVHKQPARQNVSKNVVRRFIPVEREGEIVVNRNAGSNQNISGSFAEKKGYFKRTTGARQNVSKNEMRWKPIERERDVTEERKGRYTDNGNTRFRRITTTLRPSSMLSNKERRIEE